MCLLESLLNVKKEKLLAMLGGSPEDAQPTTAFSSNAAPGQSIHTSNMDAEFAAFQVMHMSIFCVGGEGDIWQGIGEGRGWGDIWQGIGIFTGFAWPGVRILTTAITVNTTVKTEFTLENGNSPKR